MSHPLLDVKHLSVAYGPIKAVKDVSCHVSPGELVSIIGANGAGKTSFLRALSGLTKSEADVVTLDGESLAGLRADERVRRGLAQVPEGRRMFGPLSVEENLRLGTYVSRRTHSAKELDEEMDRVFTLFPRLAERRTQKVGTMSGGEQQMAAIGRALMSKPRVLLLDEPALGLAPKVVRQIFDAIVELNKAGLSVLCVEQNAALALEVSQRCYLFRLGEVEVTGESAELKDDSRVVDAYLGG
jgi:branched-chain amino acid transport system ATP-binding protein